MLRIHAGDEAGILHQVHDYGSILRTVRIADPLEPALNIREKGIQKSQDLQLELRAKRREPGTHILVRGMLRPGFDYQNVPFLILAHHLVSGSLFIGSNELDVPAASDKVAYIFIY